MVAERVFLGAAFLGADLFGRDFLPAAFFGAACFFAGFLPFLWTIAHYEDRLKSPEAPFHTGVHAITIRPLLGKLAGRSKRLLLADDWRPIGSAGITQTDRSIAFIRRVVLSKPTTIVSLA